MMQKVLLCLAFTATLHAADSDAVERAMADLRQLTTALEAYSTDYDGLYTEPDGLRDGTASDLNHVLAPIYIKTVPQTDPWGKPYRFTISNSRKLYAMYSLGPAQRLEPDVEAFLKKLRADQISETDLQQERPSQNLVFASGMLVFAVPSVYAQMHTARSESPRVYSSSEDGRNLEVIALAIESYVRGHEALPNQVRGKRVAASTIFSLLEPLEGHHLIANDSWDRPYEIAVSPSGKRAAVYTRGKSGVIDPENETLITQVQRGELVFTGMMFGVDVLVTPLVTPVDP